MNKNLKQQFTIAAFPVTIGVVTAWQLWGTHSLIIIGLLSIIIAFLLWHRLMCQMEEMKIVFDIRALLLSVLLILCGVFMYPHVDSHVYGAVISTGLFISLFIFISFRECWQRVWQQPKPALIAAIAALSVDAYAFTNRTGGLWSGVANATVLVVRTLLGLFDIQVDSASLIDSGSLSPVPVLALDHFSGVIYPRCSGMEGVFLFLFLFSVILLLDWRLFSKWRIFEIYGWGILYMLLVNMLRITAFLVFGHWVGAENEAIRELFHSWIGFILDFIAFGVFMTFLYAVENRRRLKGIS